MHKAIRLKLNISLWIEGEAEPAEDFAALTTAAVRRMIAIGSAEFPGMAVTVEEVEEDRRDEEDEENEEA
ncbi:MAG TPA: hypothetical protein VM536_00835 [Chloroflexia bacterium]|nr:hypothetical protein [Chloroflexia bacterium]